MRKTIKCIGLAAFVAGWGYLIGDAGAASYNQGAGLASVVDHTASVLALGASAVGLVVSLWD